MLGGTNAEVRRDRRLNTIFWSASGDVNVQTLRKQPEVCVELIDANKFVLFSQLNCV